MAKVERVLVATGTYFDLECAVRADLTSPVAEFLEELAAGSWNPPIQENLEPDEQVEFYDWFLAASDRLAKTGKQVHSTSYNQLQNGIWEFKHWNLRVSFYDTDGTGVYVPYIDWESYVGRFATRPWPEDFDRILRLTTGFAKEQQSKHILLAQVVRTEDLEHDC